MYIYIYNDWLQFSNILNLKFNEIPVNLIFKPVKVIRLLIPLVTNCLYKIKIANYD